MMKEEALLTIPTFLWMMQDIDTTELKQMRINDYELDR
jgi:hypothetical protein